MRHLLSSCLAILGICCFFSSPAMASGVSANVLVLPSGPGSIGGVGENVQPNLNMGLMTYPINILVPKGRGTATPTLSLSYSSSAGAGMMGIGWTLNAGARVERLTVRGLPTYTNNDRLYAGGELVKIPNSPFYRARIEGGFVRYQWKQTSQTDQKGYWIAEYPDGSRGYFGANSNGQTAPNSQVTGLQGTFRWELVTFVDRNGNRVEYTYTKDASQTYIDQISWVFDKQGTPLYQISFKYETRPDPISDGKPGFDVQTKQRLSELTITSDGKRFRSYKFTFEDATGLSRLIKVERFGRDASKRFPIFFTMKYSEATFSQQNSKFVKMPTALGVNFGNGDAEFIDMNGDGLPDVVNTAPATHRFYINELKLTPNMEQDTHDFPASLAKDNPTATNAKASNPSVQLLDFNGDGFTDLVDAVGQKIYINLGHTKWESASRSLVTFPVTQGDPNIRFFDYNGDKKIDVIRSDGSNTSYWVNDGNGSWKAVTGQVNIGLSFSADRLRLIDINGDGLMDVVHITSTALKYRKYLGHGKWSQWITMTVPGIGNYTLSRDAQFADMNGDGLADMVAFLGTSIVYFVNKNGMSFSAGQELKTFGGVELPDSTQSSIRIADMNGNGSRDIVWIDSSGKVTYLELFSKRPNLMTEISNNIGQRINVEYGSSVYFYLRDKSCQPGVDKACSGPWKNKMPMAFPLVTKITTWASRSSEPGKQASPTPEERPQVQSIFYHNGYYDGKEKKFRGFRHVETVYDGDTSVEARKDEIKFDVGDTDTYLHGRLLERIISNNAGKVYRRVQQVWKDCPVSLGGVDGKTLDPPVRFVCRTAQESVLIEGETAQAKWKTLRNEFKYDGFGNVIESASLGDKDQTKDEKYVFRDFIVPNDPSSLGAKWFLRAVHQTQYCDTSGKENCATIQFYFDGEAFKGLPAGELTKGNITRIRMRKEAGKDVWIEPLRREYDDKGNILRSQSLNGHTRDYKWDDRFQRFPVEESMKIGSVTLKATTRWEYQYSQVVESTGHNGQSQRYTYDEFGRLLSVQRPGDTPDKPAIRYSYKLQAPLSQIITEFSSKQGGSYDRQTIRCFDGLGRVINTAIRLSSASYQISSHSTYNRLNRVERLWNRYTASAPCAFAAPADTAFTSNSYDSLGRMSKKVLADGSVRRTVFGPLMRVEYDEEDNRTGSPYFATPRTILLDGQRRVISETLLSAKGEAHTTLFRYSAVNVRNQGLILDVTYPNGKKKSSTFDLIGNLLKVVDPDRGQTVYEYNASNQLVRVVNADGKETLTTYDEAGRMLTQQTKGEPGSLVTYVYDTPQKDFSDATYLSGRLAGVVSQTGQVLFSYNTRGEIAVQRHIFMGVSLDFRYGYTHDGGLSSQTMPDGQSFAMTRDGAGRTTSVSGVIDAIAYAPTGSIASWKAANGIQTTYTYNKRLWPLEINVGGGNVFQMKYAFDQVGNINTWTQSHGNDSFANAYQYDGLYRLRQASLVEGTSGQERLTLSYDILSNLVAKTSSLEAKSVAHVGQYTFDSTRIHSMTKAGQRTFRYDGSGHVVDASGLTMKWDGQGRRTETVRDGKTVMRSWYAAGPAQQIKESNGRHTFYVHEALEVREGVPMMFFKLAGMRVAQITAPKLKSIFFDDLAPATGQTKTLVPQPDGMISAGDAWLYHANRQGYLNLPAKKRPVALDLTRDMLKASAHRMLNGDTPETHYYHADHLHSVRAVTDSQGSVVGRAHYYPYGGIRKQMGERPVYGYMGAERERETGFLRFHLRSLDPATGRWLSPDPAFAETGGSNDEWNSYGMVQNNPIRFREVGGAMGNDGILRFSSNQTLQDVANIGIPLGVVAVGALLYYGYQTKIAPRYNSGQANASKKPMSTAMKIGLGASVTSIALSASAIYTQQYQADQTITNALSYSGLGFTAIYEAVNFVRAYKKHQVAKTGPQKWIGRSTMAFSGVASLGHVGAGVIMATGQANEVRLGVTMGSSALSAVASIFLMSRLDTAKQRVNGVISQGVAPTVQPQRRSAFAVVSNFFSEWGMTMRNAVQTRNRQHSATGRVRRRSTR